MIFNVSSTEKRQFSIDNSLPQKQLKKIIIGKKNTYCAGIENKLQGTVLYGKM